MKFALSIGAIFLHATLSFAQQNQLKFSLQKNENSLGIENGNAGFLYFVAWRAQDWFVFNELPLISEEHLESIPDEASVDKPTENAGMEQLGKWTKTHPTAPETWAESKMQRLCILPPQGTYNVSRQRMGNTDDRYWFVCKHELLPQFFFCFRSLAAYFSVCQPKKTNAVPEQDVTDAKAIKFEYNPPSDALIFLKKANEQSTKNEFILNHKQDEANYLLYFNSTHEFSDQGDAFRSQQRTAFREVDEKEFRTLLSMSYRLAATKLKDQTTAKSATSSKNNPIVSATFTPSWLLAAGSEKFHGRALPEELSAWGKRATDEITVDLQNQYQAEVFAITTKSANSNYQARSKRMRLQGRPQVGWPTLTGSPLIEEAEKLLPETINLELPEDANHLPKSKLTLKWNTELQAYQTQPLTVAQLPSKLLAEDETKVLGKRLGKTGGQDSQVGIGISSANQPLPFDFGRVDAIATSVSQAHKNHNLQNKNEWRYLELVAKYLEKAPSNANSQIREHRELMLIAFEHYAIRRAFQWASYFHAAGAPESQLPPFMNDNWDMMDNKIIAARAWNLINPPNKPPIIDRLEFERYAAEFRNDNGQGNCPVDDPVAFVTRDLATALLKCFGGVGTNEEKRIKLGEVTNGVLTLPTRQEVPAFATGLNEAKATLNLWLESEVSPGDGTKSEVPSTEGNNYLTSGRAAVATSPSVLTPESGVAFVLRPENFQFEPKQNEEGALTEVFDAETRKRVFAVMYNKDESTQDYGEMNQTVMAGLNAFGNADFWETEFLRDVIFAGHENYWLPFTGRMKELKDLFPSTGAAGAKKE